MNDMIDMQEAGIFLETANRTLGKVVTGVRLWAPGPCNLSEKQQVHLTALFV
jgi:hypothetical protein